MTGDHGDRGDATRFDALIEKSSLGAPGARRLRERISRAEAESIRHLADQIEATPHGADSTTAETSLSRSAEIGYRGPVACAVAGITYGQLDYWARTGLVEPSVRAAHGSGSQRLYSFRDIMVLKVVKRLLDTGISLAQIRAAVQHLRVRGTEDLSQVTLMSDGVSVYECTSADEVVDLLQGGQGIFGIALGRVWREVEGDLTVLPAVRAEDGLVTGPGGSSGRSGRDMAPPSRPAAGYGRGSPWSA